MRCGDSGLRAALRPCVRPCVRPLDGQSTASCPWSAVFVWGMERGAVVLVSLRSDQRQEDAAPLTQKVAEIQRKTAHPLPRHLPPRASIIRSSAFISALLVNTMFSLERQRAATQARQRGLRAPETPHPPPARPLPT